MEETVLLAVGERGDVRLSDALFEARLVDVLDEIERVDARKRLVHESLCDPLETRLAGCQTPVHDIVDALVDVVRRDGRQHVWIGLSVRVVRQLMLVSTTIPSVGQDDLFCFLLISPHPLCFSALWKTTTKMMRSFFLLSFCVLVLEKKKKKATVSFHEFWG